MCFSPKIHFTLTSLLCIFSSFYKQLLLINAINYNSWRQVSEVWFKNNPWNICMNRNCHFFKTVFVLSFHLSTNKMDFSLSFFLKGKYWWRNMRQKEPCRLHLSHFISVFLQWGFKSVCIKRYLADVLANKDRIQVVQMLYDSGFRSTHHSFLPVRVQA